MAETKIGVVIHADLVEALFTEDARARLNALGDVTWADKPTPLTVTEACEILRDCEIGIGSWQTPAPDAEILGACTKLRMWEHAAGSVKHCFGPHLDGRELMICSCAPAIADCVAETALAEIIVGLRRLVPNAADNRSGKTPAPPDIKSLSDATVGIIGASLVGRRVLELMAPFAPTVILYDPTVSEAEAESLGVRLSNDLCALCAASDVVSIHAPSLEATHKMIGAAQLQAMRDDAVLVNTARGSCVDEAALTAELAKGRLFAFIDVTDPEPAADDSPLRSLPNVFLTSHIAGGGYYGIGRQVVADVRAAINGEAPRRVVTAEMLATIA